MYMKLTIAVVLAVLTRATAGLAQVVAFENVNVIPMDRNRVLERQTVVIRDGRIAQDGAASRVKAPDGAVRVDGAGNFDADPASATFNVAPNQSPEAIIARTHAGDDQGVALLHPESLDGAPGGRLAGPGAGPGRRTDPPRELPTPNFQLPRHFQRPTPNPAGFGRSEATGHWELEVGSALEVGNWELGVNGFAKAKRQYALAK